MSLTPQAMSWKRRSVAPDNIRWNAALCRRFSQLSMRGDRLATTMSLPASRPSSMACETVGGHLEIGGQGKDHVALAALDAQPQGGGFTECAGEAEDAHAVPLAAQGGQLGWRGESAVEHEEKLVCLTPALELAGKRAIQLHQVVRALYHRHDHRDQSVLRRTRALGMFAARLHQDRCPHVNGPPRRSESRSRSRARCSRPLRPPGPASADRRRRPRSAGPLQGIPAPWPSSG